MTPTQQAIAELTERLGPNWNITLSGCANSINTIISALETAERERDACLQRLDENDAEIGEFQDEVRALVIKLTGAPENVIDGKGSDAGWQEFTLAEIGQGIAFLKEKLTTAEADMMLKWRHSEAACAEMRALLDNIKKLVHGVIPDSYYPHIIHALSPNCGKELLAELERCRTDFAAIKAMVPQPPNAITWEHGVDILNKVQDVCWPTTKGEK